MSHLKCIVQMVKLLVWVIDSLVTGLHWRRLASCVNLKKKKNQTPELLEEEQLKQ